MYRKCSLLIMGFVLMLLLAACGNSAANSGEASSYPEQTIELYVPYDPGGQSDLSARIVAEHMQKYLDQDIVVVNQSSGGGAVALDSVYTSKKDGYKLFYGHQATFTGYAIGQLEQTPLDLTPVATFTKVPQAYVVKADAPWENLTEFAEDAKANPGTLTYGADIGGTTHFMGGMLTDATGADVKIVDAGGESERMAALLGDQVDMVVTSIGNALTYVESGDYKVLSILSEEKDPSAPDFPTAAEQGFDINFSVIHTLYGPPEMSEDALNAWNEATEKLASDEEYLAAVEEIKQAHLANQSDETAELVKTEFDYIQELAKDLGY